MVVFASQVDQESIWQLEGWGARVCPFRFRGKHVTNRLARLWPIWKWIFSSRLPAATKRQLAHQVFHLFYRRHLLYLDFLREYGGSYERFLVTDCRDVFFQGDPFGWPQTSGLHVFLEDESMQVLRCTHHTRWLRSQFGEKIFENMGNEIVSCAGTVFGDRTSMAEYLERMVNLSMGARSLREADGDQGIHNFLVRRKPMPKMTIHRNGQGPVMTVGAMTMNQLSFSSDGWVTNDRGAVAPVLHQYDRIVSLREMLLHRIQDDE